MNRAVSSECVKRSCPRARVSFGGGISGWFPVNPQRPTSAQTEHEMREMNRSVLDIHWEVFMYFRNCWKR